MNTPATAARSVCRRMFLRAGSVLGVLILTLFALMAQVGIAQAQNVDWLVNIDDVGFENSPAGGTIEYVVDIDNFGFQSAPATTVDFSVPADSELLSITGDFTGCGSLPVVGPGSVTCNVPPLASNGQASAVVEVIGSNSAVVASLTVSVPTAGDDLPGNNSQTEQTTVIAGADMQIMLNVPATASSGGFADFELVALNNGPNTANSFRLEFPIPGGIADVTGAGGGALPSGCSISAGSLICNVSGSLATGNSISRTFRGQVSAAGSSDVTATASVVNANPTDPIITNNTDTGTFPVTGGTDVSIDIRQPDGSTYLVGETSRFVISSAYTGDSPTGLTVTTTIPSAYTITGISSPDGWSCSTAPATQDVTCTLAGGSVAGANIDLGDIFIDTTVASAATPIVSASISASAPTESFLGNNTDSIASTITEPVVDLRANKTGPNPQLVVVGNSYSYTISATNIGNAAFDGTARMVDTIPPGLVVTGISGGGFTCTPGAGTTGADITCDRDYSGAPLNSGATSGTVTVTVDVLSPGVISNRMVVSAVGGTLADNNLPNNEITYNVTSSTGPNAADIRVLKSAAPAAPATIQAGEVQTFTIEVVNDGPNTSRDIEVTDNLTTLINNTVGPTGSGFISASVNARAATGVSCSSSPNGTRARLLECDISELPVCTPGAGGDCPQITVQVRPGGNAGTYNNTVDVLSTTTPDPDLTNRTGSASYAITARADITVLKSVTPATGVAGQNLTYVVTAQNLNNGFSTAENVTVFDTLPDNVTFVSATPSNGSCLGVPATNTTTSGTILECNLGNIGTGGQRTLTVVVRPNNITAGTTITNNARVETTTVETDTTNNATSISANINSPVLDISISKDATVDPVIVGESTVYVLTLRHVQGSASENVVVTDQMPASIFEYQSFTAPGASSCTAPASGTFGGVLECNYPYLEPGGERVIEITYIARSKGTISTPVSISSDEIVAGFDSRASNNQTDEQTTARTSADIEVTSKVAPVNPVNLRESFDFVITVTNNTGAGLAEADGVTLTDSLPADMVLTGTPVVVEVSGNATSLVCTGVVDDTSFTCDFGTVDNGAVLEITAPVKILNVSSLPQTFTNTASVATQFSFDPDTSNNSNSGTVSVDSSSLAGTVYRDFDDSATPTVAGQDLPADTGIAGITMSLSGTAFDSSTVTRSVVTDTDGNYIFRFLPQGTYTVTRGPVSEPRLTTGQNTNGSEGGTLVSNAQIASIPLPSNTAAVDYDFAEIPSASVGIAKQVVGAPTVNADGSFNTTFRLTVENFSLEPLTAVQVTDQLQGAAPLFGSFVPLGSPATDPMTDGSYTVLTAPAGSCGGISGGFNGAGATAIASGFDLALNATCTIEFALRIQPTDPLPPVLASGGRYENQAVVTATGAVSGQTSTGPNANPDLTDLSDDGADPDPNGNRDAGEATENDPTPVIPAYSPSITLIKTADVSALTTPSALAGETITYNFAITNTGDVNLANVTLTETLIGAVVSGGPIPLLAPGQTDNTTFTATYDLTQPDVDADQVINSATTEGTDPYGTVVSDISGTTNGDDTPLNTPLVPTPRITLVKTADASGFSTPPTVGDPITYSFTLTNTGNVTLTNVTVTDTSLPGLILSGAPIPTMAPGDVDTTTYTATYALTLADIVAGTVANTATVTGTPPSGPDVNDISGTDQVNDLPTEVPVQQAPAIALDKIVDDSATREGAMVGDELTYTFTVTNTGNLPLNNVTVTDMLAGVMLNGSPIPVMNPGDVDTTTYTATYAITQADIDVGEVVNDATVEGFYGPGNTLSVTADDVETGGVGNIEAISEVFPPFETDGGVTTCMLASDLLNNQPATLGNVSIRVISEDPGVTLDPATCLITLAAGNPAGEYKVEYEICSIATPALCDTTTETVVQSAIPGIEVTKTQVFEDNGDGRQDIGDTLIYTITVENTGNTPLENVDLVDTLTDLNGAALTLTTLPTFQSADAGSPEGMLEIDEIATYRATFIVTQQAVNSTGVENTVTATALPVFEPGVPGTPTPVDDISDNGEDADGNNVDDPTTFVFVPSATTSGLTLTKTTSSDVVRRGEAVPYTITVRNDNTFRAGPFDLVDTLPRGFLYVPDSSSIPGAVSTGGRITWPDVTIPASSSLTVTITARILSGARAGEHINTVTLLDPDTGGQVTAPATALVRILPEAVFDCGDVIGKVFEDHNGNGYQDGTRTAGISDQTYGGGKAGKPIIAPGSQVEKGIPNVRLATVDGSIITTDQNGLFSVPCAMLPADRGSNFILKVDDRTLPAGYRLTTENPRVMRLTPGMMTEMNFGARIGKVVRIDLASGAFMQNVDGIGMSGALRNGIARLLPQIAGDAANLRLAFHVPQGATAQDIKQARRMMRMTEKHINAEWRKVGRTRLLIEKTIVRAGE